MDEQRTAKRRAKRQKRKVLLLTRVGLWCAGRQPPHGAQAKKKPKGADGAAVEEQDSGSEDDTPAALSAAALEID